MQTDAVLVLWRFFFSIDGGGIRFLENEPFAEEIIHDHDDDVHADFRQAAVDMQQVDQQKHARHIHDIGEQAGAHKFASLPQQLFEAGGFALEHEQLVDHIGENDGENPGNGIAHRVAQHRCV